MNERDTILLRETDPQRREETERLLRDLFTCVTVATVAEAHEALVRRPCAAAVVSGADSSEARVTFCRELHQRHPDVKIVLVADAAVHASVIDAFNEHCLFRCLRGPVPPAALASAMRAAVRRREMDRVQAELLQRAEEIDRQVHSAPYLLHRFHAALASLLRTAAGSVGLCLVAVAVLFLAGVGVFLLLYQIKSALGIDLFPDRHLNDLLSR